MEIAVGIAELIAVGVVAGFGTRSWIRSIAVITGRLGWWSVLLAPILAAPALVAVIAVLAFIGALLAGETLPTVAGILLLLATVFAAVVLLNLLVRWIVVQVKPLDEQTGAGAFPDAAPQTWAGAAGVPGDDVDTPQRSRIQRGLRWTAEAIADGLALMLLGWIVLYWDVSLPVFIGVLIVVVVAVRLLGTVMRKRRAAAAEDPQPEPDGGS